MRLSLCLGFFGAFLHGCLGSRGDTLPRFQECRRACESSVCHGLESTAFTPLQPALRLLQWDCESNCDYQCRRQVTLTLRQEGRPTEQFYGKWPFIRVMGIQELFSVAFSLANLYSNAVAWKTLRKFKLQLQDPSLVMVDHYIALVACSCVGWLASTVFHIRDFPLTETLDYFFATAIIWGQLLAIVVRYFQLYLPVKRRTLRVVHCGFLLWYLFHCAKLLHFWDYRYNTRVSVITGLVTNAFWVAHATRVHRRSKRDTGLNASVLPYEQRVLERLARAGIRYPARFIGLVPLGLLGWIMLGMSFELFDFPPWGDLVDGHAIWHLFTFLPPLVWYDWNVWDLQLQRHHDRQSGKAR